MENSAPKSTYKNLLVYQKAKKLTVDVINFFRPYKLPRTQEFLVVQLLRATSSIGANIAEGYGRMYKKSYRQFLSVARGSSFEVDYWLEVISETDMFNQLSVNKFINSNVEIVKMLTIMMKKMEARN